MHKKPAAPEAQVSKALNIARTALKIPAEDRRLKRQNEDGTSSAGPLVLHVNV